VPQTGGGYNAWMIAAAGGKKTAGEGEEETKDTAEAALDPAAMAAADLAAELGVTGVDPPQVGMALAEKEALVEPSRTYLARHPPRCIPSLLEFITWQILLPPHPPRLSLVP